MKLLKLLERIPFSTVTPIPLYFPLNLGSLDVHACIFLFPFLAPFAIPMPGLFHVALGPLELHGQE